MSLRLLGWRVALLLAASTATVSLCQKPPTPRETVWFALREEFGSNGKIILDRIAAVSDGKLSKVPDDCSYEDPAYKQFFAEYFNGGHSYSVLFGGVAAGNAVVREHGEDSASYAVDYRGPARIRGQIMGLATNAVVTQAVASSRQAPTSEDRLSALDLAKNLFAQAGVPPDLLAKIKVRNLTHTVLPPSKSPSLIGSFFIEVGGARGPTHNLFFIATFNGTGYAPELVWTKISKDELESDTVTFVDQGDLFGDGDQEVIVHDRGWENYVYRIYRRTKTDASHWEPIFETGIFGCA
jgi:hypothetical protein